MLGNWLNNIGFLQWVNSLNNPRSVSREQLLFCWACLEGKQELVEFMLQERTKGGIHFQANFNQNLAFQQSAKNGHYPIVIILSELNECDPLVDTGYCLIIAAEKNHIAIVKYLADLQRSDQNGSATFVFNKDNINNALLKASYQGHLQIVEFLLNYRRQDYVCDITAKDHEAIKISSFNNKFEVANLLAEAYHSRNLKVPCTPDIINNLQQRVKNLLISAQLINYFTAFGFSDELIEPIISKSFPLSNNSVQVCFQLAKNRRDEKPIDELTNGCDELLTHFSKCSL